MSQTYQNKPVTVERTAKQGDPNFVAGSDQVIIRNANGQEQTVPRTDVKG